MIFSILLILFQITFLFAQTNRCVDLFGTSSCTGETNPDPYFTNIRAIFVRNHSFVEIPFAFGHITNFLLGSSSNLTCSSLSFCLNIPYLSSEHCFVAFVSQLGSNACYVSLNNVFSNSSQIALAQQDTNMTMIIGTSTVSTSFYVDIYQDEQTDFTLSNIKIPSYYLNYFNVSTTSDADIVQLKEQFAYASCNTDPSHAWIQFFSENQTNDNICTMNMTFVDESHIRQGSISRGFINRCYFSHTQDLYTFIARPFLHSDTCTDVTNTGLQSMNVSFLIHTDTNGIVSAQLENTTLQSVHLLNSTYTHIGSSQCDNRISLMDKVAVIHTVQYTWSVELSSSALVHATSNATFGDLSMTMSNLSCIYNSENGTTSSSSTCTIEYVSDECIPMIQNLNQICIFEFPFGKFTGADTWYTYTYIDNNLIESPHHSLSNHPLWYPNTTTTCNDVLPVQDITSSTSVTLSSFSNPNVNVLEMAIQGTNYNSSITIAISEVRITAIDSDEKVFVRTFSILDKIRLMNIRTSSYFSDVHYCRYIDTDQHSCDLPFYNKLKNETMFDQNLHLVNPNQTIVQNMSIGDAPYLVENYGYETCQDVRARDSDRWAFNPSMWIFQDMKRTGIIYATAQVTAVVSTCTTQDGYNNDRRRLLLLSNEKKNTIVKTSTSLQFNHAPTTTNTNLSSLEIWLIVLCSTLFAILLGICCIVYFLYNQILSKQDKKPVMNPSPTA